MVGNLLKSFEADISQIPKIEGNSDTPRDKVLKTLAHAYLRLWTRLALESGQRLTLSPSQFTLGTYEGQMHWVLNESVDYKGISQLSMGAVFRKKHSLVAETYVLKGEERARLLFSLEEEKVKGRPVFVNYLVYDAPLGEFNIVAAMEVLKPILPAWLETIISADDKPLWSACDGLLECVGI
ncbi:MAG: hypothetical protein JW880_06000 [Candidatus Thermoplasmatota archaeon]|nr:hypothetical protein [Candidatus Thermoplasmatota archaeon]